jgi:pantetheine-phosphate adenylyltransferase
MQQKIGVFPGSFDPITKGHESVILKALPLFDKIYIAIGENSEKKYLFPLEQRKQWIAECFKQHPKIEVVSYTGLTVDFCKKVEAQFLIRGIRNTMDFEFEKGIADVNLKLSGIDTVFFIADSQYSAFSSSIVREVYKNGGVIDSLVPNSVKP